MSKLDELIRQCCPDGVEYVKLEKIVNIVSGKDYKHLGKGDVPVYGSGGIMNYVDTPVYSGETVLLPRKGSISNVFYLNGPFWNVDTVFYTTMDEAIILPRYFYHFILSEHIEKYNTSNAARPALTRTVLNEIEVPLPALPVQREIVRILDSFTLYSAELAAELAARREQFKCLRDYLILNQDDVPMVKIKDIEKDIFRGSGIKRTDVTDTGIPCVRYGEIYTAYNTWFNRCISHTSLDSVQSPKYIHKGDILFAITGENIEDIAKSTAYLGDEECLAGGDIVVLRHTQNSRYLAHALLTSSAVEQKGKGKVKSKVVHSNVPSIENIEIPLPNLAIQEAIANKLDNFERLVNDISQGLPAEIEARQKQYEYYRDKLLTFKRKEA